MVGEIPRQGVLVPNRTKQNDVVPFCTLVVARVLGITTNPGVQQSPGLWGVPEGVLGEGVPVIKSHKERFLFETLRHFATVRNTL